MAREMHLLKKLSAKVFRHFERNRRIMRKSVWSLSITVATLLLLGSSTEAAPGETTYYSVVSNEKEIKALGNDEQLKGFVDECANATSEYDDYGNAIEYRCVGLDEQLLELDGIARFRSKYDGRKNLIEQRFFGTDGTLKELEDLGAAIIEWQYDAANTIVETRFYGSDEQPMPRMTILHSKYRNPEEFVDFLSDRCMSNESSAISAVRDIVVAQLTYSATTPGGNYAPDLSTLEQSQVIDSITASGTQHGYTFTTTTGDDGSTFTVNANPVVHGILGGRYFLFADESGYIRYTKEDRAATAGDPAF